VARTEALAELNRLYVDADIFIYFVEGEGAERETVTALFVEAAERNVQLVTSEITIAECLRGALKDRDEPAAATYRDMLSNSDIVEMVTADPVLYEYAALAGCTFSLNLLDAIHVASAVIGECEGLLTNDKGIRGPDILKIIQLSDESSGLSSHSHITSVRQPRASSAARFRASRARFPAIFATQ
jgi:predicted nucleic acid-binding protein